MGGGGGVGEKKNVLSIIVPSQTQYGQPEFSSQKGDTGKNLDSNDSNGHLICQSCTKN